MEDNEPKPPKGTTFEAPGHSTFEDQSRPLEEHAGTTILFMVFEKMARARDMSAVIRGLKAAGVVASIDRRGDVARREMISSVELAERGLGMIVGRQAVDAVSPLFENWKKDAHAAVLEEMNDWYARTGLPDLIDKISANLGGIEKSTARLLDAVGQNKTLIGEMAGEIGELRDARREVSGALRKVTAALASGDTLDPEAWLEVLHVLDTYGPEEGDQT